MNLPDKFRIKNICSGFMRNVEHVGNSYHISEQGATAYSKYSEDAVESFIERGLWEIVEEIPEAALPHSFEFQNSVGSSCSARIDSSLGKYLITWNSCDNGELFKMWLPLASVKEHISKGIWKIVDERSAPWEIGEYEIIKTISLLEKLKQLTINTTTNIFIVNGQYEVYFDAFSNPAKAATDEELEKIVEAILTLNKAVNGDDNA